jgi:hypothetical protein
MGNANLGKFGCMQISTEIRKPEKHNDNTFLKVNIKTS